MSKITSARLNPVWHRMVLYGCTHYGNGGRQRVKVLYGNLFRGSFILNSNSINSSVQHLQTGLVNTTCTVSSAHCSGLSTVTARRTTFRF